MGRIGIRTVTVFNKPMHRHKATRKRQMISDRNMLAKEDEWSSHASNKTGWKPSDKCPHPGCDRKSDEKVRACGHKRIACAIHAPLTCASLKCTCKMDIVLSLIHI